MPRVHVILLAAGKSSRFGKNKLLMDTGGKPLYQHMPDLIDQLNADRIGQKCIVSRFPEILESMKQRGYQCVRNEMPDSGISHSIFLGIRELLEKGDIEETDAILFSVCDQPFLKKETVERLIEGFQASGKGIACLCDEKKTGNPVIFSKQYWKELMSLKGDRGGKQVLYTHPEDVCFCPVEEKLELLDIDTEEVYQRMFGGLICFGYAAGNWKRGSLREMLFTGKKKLPHIISIAGAGGKTTMAMELARELKAEGKRVLVTTTTHMKHPQENYYEWKGERPLEEQAEGIRRILEQREVWIVGKEDADGKIRGIPEREYEFLSELTEILIVEADGSKGYPVKVPGVYEPVLYPGTDFFLGVMGYPAIGKPIYESSHHPERTAAFLETDEAHVLTQEDLFRIMRDRRGLLKQVTMPYMLLLNRCPPGFRPESAEESMRHLLICEEKKDFSPVY
ncbi:MAG TPA: putative selenium-dependent hydroxylase accessory protein YqeC [Lachnospiraceae bacterium]|nr:putative selenium-dependent hydroxylase accessory protein YqeC [Lachnospiraceae bacterium]